jgi:Holliday junction resolvase RusA-like endonuclease
MVKLIIPGEPVAKARPRVTKSGIAYTPAKTKNYETLVQELYIINYPDKVPLEGELIAMVNAYFTIPKSASKKKRKLMSLGDIRPTKRPDLDNIAKSILDALNSLAYKDDSQIVSLTINKYYSEKPRVEVGIDKLKEGLL